MGRSVKPGSRFVQTDLSFNDSREVGLFAIGLGGVDRDLAAGKMVRIWGWALDLAFKSPSNDPLRHGEIIGEKTEVEYLLADAARWSGDRAQLAASAVRAGFFEWTKNGGRFRGWRERYGQLLRKQIRDNGKEFGRNSGGIRAESGRADPDPDPDSDTEIYYNLKISPEAQKRSEAEDPRARSWHLQHFDAMQASRVERLTALGVTAEAERVGKGQGEYRPGFVADTLAKIAHAAGGGLAHGRMSTLRVFDAYLAKDWPIEKKPPFAFQVFASKKTWQPLLEQLEPEPAETAA